MAADQGLSPIKRLFRGAFIYLMVPMLFAGGPIVWFSGAEWWSHLTNSLSRIASAEARTTSCSGGEGADGPSAGGESATEPSAAQVQMAASPATGADAMATGTPIYDLAEVLRFDVTPRWIADRWPRVSAAVGQLELRGYRVPLVTGAAEDDLAGALTYYFNPWQQVQRITFFGTTGNVQKTLHLLTNRFHFARRLTNDPGIFLYEVQSPDGKTTSALWIRHAPVVKASQPRQRYEVALTLERPKEK